MRYYTDNKNNLHIEFEYLGTSVDRVIPVKGMARWLHDNEGMESVAQFFKNQIKQTRQYEAIMRDVKRQKKRDECFCVNEKKKAVKKDEPIYEDMK